MFPNVPLSIGRKRVFDSVFPPPPLGDTSPASESGGGRKSAESEKPSGGEASESAQQRHQWQRDDELQHGETDDSQREQAVWDRAWASATTYLSIPDRGFNLDREGRGANDDELDEEVLIERWAKEPPSQFVSDNIFYVAADASRGRELRIGRRECDLQEWYMGETRRHFLANFRNPMVKQLGTKPRNGVLRRLVRYLRLSQNIYYMPFVKHVLPLLDTTAQDQAFARLQQSVHDVISYSLPDAELSGLLTEELTADTTVILGVNRAPEGHQGGEESTNVDGDDSMDLDQKYTTSYEDWKNEPSNERRSKMMTEGEDTRVSDARSRLLHIIEGLQSVGLGGRRIETVFAEIMNRMITEFISSTYASQWTSPSLACEHLQHWIENVFSRLVAQVLHVLKRAEQRPSRTDDPPVTLGDVEKWQEMGMARLGSLRIGELFDIIVEWDVSKGAIEDLRHYTTNPATRFLLTSSFLSTLSQRLLHPGASTVEILQVYISIIRAFVQLDPRGVLLDRVAKPVRRYLKDRDDTVNVIVAGLLSDSTETSEQTDASNTETLPEIAHELSNAHQQALRDDSGELDWDDMNWTPDPVDAALDYKKSKIDVIGSLISLFDTKEVLVKELQKALSERLLKKNRGGGYDLEISVLELLKIRFGDTSLQACEVMLRDVLDSKRVDTFIRAEQKKGAVREEDDTEDMEISEGGDQLELHAKILSRLYWPIKQDVAFRLPEEVQSVQEKYSASFEALKPSRKLTWLNGLGRVTVELDLEDRLFQDEVTTWQATVIYAFQSPASSTAAPAPATKTVKDLAEQLAMPTALVRSACLFWLSKRVLTEIHADMFQVLETLPDEDEDEDEDHNNVAGLSASHMSTTSAGGTGRAPTRKPRFSVPSSQTAAAAAAVAAQESAAKESAHAETLAKMDFYWQFIVGMLTNQGAMPLQGIITMLKMVVPGGFPFSSEELKDFLGQKVAQGQLERVDGGNYKIVK